MRSMIELINTDDERIAVRYDDIVVVREISDEVRLVRVKDLSLSGDGLETHYVKDKFSHILALIHNAPSRDADALK